MKPYNAKPWQVRAMLDGKLSVLVLPLKPQPCQRPVVFDVTNDKSGGDVWTDRQDMFRCPLGKPGDVLWWRETWAPHYTGLDVRIVHYRADLPNDWNAAMTEDHAFGLMQWKPSTQMPIWASRIHTEITSVDVKRVREINGEEIEAAGIVLGGFSTRRAFPFFKDRWDKMHPGSWDRNDWCWFVGVKRVKP